MSSPHHEGGDRPRYRKAVIVLNPVAGRGRGLRAAESVERAVRLALGPTCSVSRRLTSPEEGAEELAREAVREGADLIIAAGGDGTLHGVVNGAAGAPATVAQIPLGTGNDFARAVGIPARPAEAAGVLASGHAALVDLGKLGNQLFINAAGCGFDAAVAERVNRGFRSLGGPSAYIAAVIATLLSYRATVMTITVDGQRVERRAMLCAVANGTGYGGGMRLAPEARWDDGMLDVCIVAECSRIEFLRAFPQVFRGAHTHHPKVQMLRGKRMTVESDPPVGVLVDGEITGTTPVIIETVPSALRFVVP